jgi:phenylacetate-CoA ligase
MRAANPIESVLEGLERHEVECQQLSRTVDQTRWVMNASYWAQTLRINDCGTESLKSPDDLLKLPTLTKKSYREAISSNPPYGGFLCRALLEIEREGAYLFRTTGTTGRQTSIIKSKDDLAAFARCGARNMSIAGVSAGDYVFMTFPYTMWTAAWGFYHGSAMIGATIVPAGAPLPTEMRIALLEEYKPRALVCTPSYGLAFAEAVKASGRDPAAMGVQIILVGGEPISTSRRRRIENAWGAPKGVRNFSGISEVAGVYLGVECPAQTGMHVYEDVLRCDVLVPDADEWASPDAGGELVVTSLVKTALSINYRFRTGDYVYFTDEPCACGRTSRRLLSIETRLDDMRKIRGINVWASAVEDLLQKVSGSGDEFELRLCRSGELDEVIVRAEANPCVQPEEYSRLAEEISGCLRSALGIRLPVEIVPPGSLPRYELKAKRWVDTRPAEPE